MAIDSGVSGGEFDGVGTGDSGGFEEGDPEGAEQKFDGGGPKRSGAVEQWGVDDSPKATDTLGFDPHVRVLFEFLTNPRTRPPLTVSIEGPWGAGKSSFMRRLQRHLRDERYITVWFNPWRHEREEALWAAFMLVFFEQVTGRLSLRDRWVGHLRLFRRRLRWGEVRRRVALMLVVVLVGAFAVGAGYVFLPGGGTTLSAGAVTVGLGATAAVGSVAVWLWRDVVNPIAHDLRKYTANPEYEDHVAFVHQFHADFDKILEAYVPTDQRVFVFVDDLDRCAPPKAADLLQSINLMLDNGDVFFVVGMDSRMVAASVAAKHARLLRYVESDETVRDEAVIAERFGRDYIEKFVQLPFPLPVLVDESVQRFADDLVSEPTPAESAPSGGLMSTGTALAIRISRALRKTPWPEPPTSETVATDREVSRALSDILPRVSEALEENPRLLKRFVNLFRIRAMYAARRGIVDRYPEQWTWRLAEAVVLSIRWPEVILRAEDDSEFVGAYRAFVSTGSAPPKPVADWPRDERESLLELVEKLENTFQTPLDDEIVDLFRANPVAGGSDLS